MTRDKKEEAASAIAGHRLFTDELAEMIMKRGGVDVALMALEREFFSTITVPDLPSADLLGMVKRCCRLTYLCEYYRGYELFETVDYWPIRGRGKVFRYLVWAPQRNVTSEQVREYFKGKGFYGNAPAFLAWIADKTPKGYYASIPDAKECFCISPNNYATIYVPYFQSADDQRRLDWKNSHHGDAWDGGYSFVGFRELGG